MHKFFISLLVAAFVFSLASVGAVNAQDNDVQANQPAWGKHINGWLKKQRDLENRPQLTDEEILARKQARLKDGAEILGISPEEFQAKLDAGMKLPEIAKELGINKEDLGAKMREQAKIRMTARLNQLVADGKITQGQADKRLGQMQKRAESQGRHMGQRAGRGLFPGCPRPHTIRAQ